MPQRQQTLQRALPHLWDDPQFLSIELHDLLEKTIPVYLEPMVRQGTEDGSIQTPDPAALCEALFLLAGAFAKRLSLRRGTAALWCITAVCALLGLAVLPCVPAAAGYIAVTVPAFCMMAGAALFQILLYTAIQTHAPAGQTGRFMSLVTVCACPGQASAVLFAAAAASVFVNTVASDIFKDFVCFTKS